MKITPQTSTSDLTQLSKELALTEASTRLLRNRGANHLYDFDNEDVLPTLSSLGSEVSRRDAARFFAILIRSGVGFNLSNQAPISELGILSNAALDKLSLAGYDKLLDISGVYYPDIYKLIGYGAGKFLLVAVVTAGIKPRFRTPDWSQEDWRAFLESLVSSGIVEWEDVAVSVLSELNPPQVGTAVANAVKHNYGPGKTMREVWSWFYALSGRCEASGKRLFLEVDHREPKEAFLKTGRNVKEADRLDNFQLLTKRANVTKRGSHRLGGISFANAATVLMYVLFRHKPRSLTEFAILCREYGLTMSSIRFQEAWAMAIWLNRDGMYDIDSNSPPAAGPLEDVADELDLDAVVEQRDL